MDLFAGLPEAQQPIAGHIDVPRTLDQAIAVFLNRWHWRGPREVVEQELRELIETVKSEAVS